MSNKYAVVDEFIKAVEDNWSVIEDEWKEQPPQVHIFDEAEKTYMYHVIYARLTDWNMVGSISEKRLKVMLNDASSIIECIYDDWKHWVDDSWCINDNQIAKAITRLTDEYLDEWN